MVSVEEEAAAAAGAVGDSVEADSNHDNNPTKSQTTPSKTYYGKTGHRSMFTTIVATLAVCVAGGSAVDKDRRSTALAMPAETENSPTEEVISDGGGVPRPIGERDVGSGSNLPDQQERPGAELNLHSSQKRFREEEASDKLTMGERSPKRAALQNVDNEGRKGLNHPGSLDGQDARITQCRRR